MFLCVCTCLCKPACMRTCVYNYTKWSSFFFLFLFSFFCFFLLLFLLFLYYYYYNYYVTIIYSCTFSPLGGFDLTPTYRNVHNKFSLKYYLNLVLVDEEDRRYFKQQEITLWRRAPRKRVAGGAGGAAASADQQPVNHGLTSTNYVQTSSTTGASDSDTTTATPTTAPKQWRARCRSHILMKRKRKYYVPNVLYQRKNSPFISIKIHYEKYINK